MAFSVPNGALVHLAKTYSDPLTFISISNDKNAKITVDPAHGLVPGDVVHLRSSWSDINDVVAEVSNVAGDEITLGLIDTSNQNRFLPGSGTGSLRKVEGWAEIEQLTQLSASGGEQQKTQVQFLSSDRQININTVKSPKTQSLTLGHDATLPIYDVLRAADYSQETLAVRMYIPKKNENRYYSVKVGFDDMPNTAVNEIESVTVTFEVQSSIMTFYDVKAKAVTKTAPKIHNIAKTKGK